MGTRVSGSLYVGDNLVDTFVGNTSPSFENNALSDVIAQIQQVRELSNQAITNLMNQQPDEGKEIDLEGEEEEGQEEPESKKKEAENRETCN